MGLSIPKATEKAERDRQRSREGERTKGCESGNVGPAGRTFNGKSKETSVCMEHMSWLRAEKGGDFRLAIGDWEWELEWKGISGVWQHT